MRRFAVIAVSAALASACGALATSPGDGELGRPGRYELRVTHEYDPLRSEIVDPSELDASYYVPVEDGEVYLVELSEGGEAVEIWPAEVTDAMVMISGRLADGYPSSADVATNVRAREHLRYWLDEGLFAGGHLLVWAEGPGLRAELTAYGSGVPMVSTRRGDLIPID